MQVFFLLVMLTRPWAFDILAKENKKEMTVSKISTLSSEGLDLKSIWLGSNYIRYTISARHLLTFIVFCISNNTEELCYILRH